jgi:hypothetical protein
MAETPQDFARRLLGGVREPEQEAEQKTGPDETPEQEPVETEPDLIAALTQLKPWAKALFDRLHPPEGEA